MAKNRNRSSAGEPDNIPVAPDMADAGSVASPSTADGVTDQTSLTADPGAQEPDATLPVTDVPPGEPLTDEIERLKKELAELHQAYNDTLEQLAKVASPTTITVDRAAFEKMMVALSMGHAENYLSQSCVVQVMALFELKTRDEGVKKLAELRQSHRDRVEKGG